MSRSVVRMLAIGLAGWLLTVCAASRAQEPPMSDLVEQALDQPVAQRIEIADKPILEALAQLEQPTGLRFAVAGSAVAALPYGEHTQITLVIENVSVRKGLKRVLDGLGMQMRVEGAQVMIEAGPVLRRLDRRMSLEDAAVLGRLAARPWKEIAGETPIQFLPDDSGAPAPDVAALIAAAPGQSALEQLDNAAISARLAWTLRDGRVAVFSRRQDVLARLNRPISVTYQRVALDDLLADLGRRADVELSIEPGALLRVAGRERLVDLVQRRTTAREVLERICGNTGLAYSVTDAGVSIAAPAKAAGGAGRVVAILRVPVGGDGTTIEFLLRDDELPVEFRNLLDRKMPLVIEELRKAAP